MPSATKVQTGYLEAVNPFALAPGNPSSPTITFTNSSSTGMFSPSIGALAFSTSETQNALTILANGNVGIGNTNPGAKLDVSGDIRLSGADAEIEFNTGGARLKGRVNALSIHTGSGLDSEASEQVRINNTGVGIGTTNPQNPLHISGTQGTLLRLDGGSEGTGTRDIFISEFNTTAFGGIIRYDSVADLFTFGTVEFATVVNAINVTRASGNVGIGTTNPGAKLSVGSGSLVDGNVPVQISTPSANGIAYYGANNNGSYGALFGYDRGTFSGGVVRVVGATDTIDFVVTGATKAATILPSGNVGIGTTNPTSTLQVAGDITITPNSGSFRTIGAPFSSNTTLLLQGGAVSGSGGNIELGRDSTNNYDANIHVIRSVDATTEYVRINTTGVGIGTTNPTAKLDVNGTIKINDGAAGGNTTAFGSYKRLLFDNVFNDTARGPNKITMYNDGNTWAAGFGIHANTVSYYSGGTHKWYKVNSQTSFTETLNIDSSGNLITPNNIGAGLDIGYKKYVTITGSFAANTWYNTGIDRTTDTGIYLLDAWVDTYNTGQSWHMSYIGWFVMPNRATNAGNAAGITLHSAGHAPNAEVIQFRTLLTPHGDGRIYLQWQSNFALTLDGSPGRNIQVAIHRFATALNN